MVSIKFWRGKFSRPATGYECIAHAPAFDRGVGVGHLNISSGTSALRMLLRLTAV